MDFKTKKIRKLKKKRENKLAKKASLFLKSIKIPGLPKIRIKLKFSTISILLITILLIAGIIKACSSSGLQLILETAGSRLKTDAYGHTNFLLLGTGGKEHDGADLTDTIIVASLDPESKLVTLISIPRDLYIQDQTVGNSKINEVYHYAKLHFGDSRKGLDHFKSKVETLTGIPIHYWAKVNFSGFKDLIDALGGVDIYVDEAIYDPFYPKDGTILFEPFSISAGQHHLDGETALKYARSRKTTSDFDRANRQQKIIYAIKEKALNANVLLNPARIESILKVLDENVSTNISVQEILTLGSMAQDFSADQITHRLIHDDPGQCGGLLYNPPWESYGGIFVLVPAGGTKYVHLYNDFNLNSATAAQNPPKLAILNGTQRFGAAAETKQVLRRFCFDIPRFGNAKEKGIEMTNYYYRESQRPEALNFLQKIIPGNEVTTIPLEYEESGFLIDSDLIIELGENYTSSKNYLEDHFYEILLEQAIRESEEAAAEEAKAESDVNSTTPASTE